MTVTVTAPALPSAPVKAVVLPVMPAQEWSKPLNGGETYTPSHPGLFHVEFQSSAQPGVESYSSKLVADKVSLLCSVTEILAGTITVRAVLFRTSAALIVAGFRTT